jgi:hypothetical protein
MMSEEGLRRIERRIERIEEEIAKTGPMRPGSLSRQYKDPKTKRGPYWQASRTRAMKSRSDYVRSDCVADVRKETSADKRFMKLKDEWIDLGVEASKLRMKVERKTGLE